MRTKKYTFLLLIALLPLFSSCHRVSLQELQQYVKDPKNGLIHTRRNAGGSYTLMYKPLEFMYYLKYGTDPAHSFSAFRKENENVFFFEVDIRLNKKAGATIEPFQFETTRQNFSINSGLNGGYPLSYHMERTNEKEGIVSLSFECEPGKDIQITYKDIYTGQDLTFPITAEALKALPKSKLQ
ncbi:MAG: hypothetical protein IBJ09_12095 [Bacteroidia bacterium]|nr:hypothetical protein [Bacteroidia bacterium]